MRALQDIEVDHVSGAEAPPSRSDGGCIPPTPIEEWLKKLSGVE